MAETKKIDSRPIQLRGLPHKKGKKKEDPTIPDEKIRFVEKYLNGVPRHHRNKYLRSVLGISSVNAAVNTYCLQCVGWVSEEREKCTAQGCPLFYFRFGSKQKTLKKSGSNGKL